MKAQVTNTIRKYNMLRQDAVVVLAVSGGVDSMVMLELFKNLAEVFGLTIIVAHLDHNKRETSKDDAQLVRDVTLKYGFIYEGEVLPKKSDDGNFHAYARDFRYRFFKRVAKRYNASCVATAHHIDDHLETVIDRLMKNGTPDSLQGIRPVARIYSQVVIRPLIDVSKAEIYDYAATNCVRFNEDVSNASDIYLRNRIRHNIIPHIVNERADAPVHVRDLSDNLSADEDYFNLQVTELIAQFEKIDDVLEINVLKLRLVHESLLRRMLVRFNPCITKSATTVFLEFLFNDSSTGEIHLGDGLVARKVYDVFQFSNKKFIQKKEDYVLELSIGIEKRLPDGKKICLMQGIYEKNEKNEAQATHLCYNSIRMPIRVRNRRSGDKIKLINMSGHASVKKIMIDKKIPVMKRDSLPIVVDATGLVLWIPGIKKSPACLDKPNSKEDLWLEIYE